jgi:2-polyprenyl-3-methyl-5-hydroxy-6-metoxy-1,4-benzoquinol methylase
VIRGAAPTIYRGTTLPTIYRNKKELIERSITPATAVLDVGFWGQGTGIHSPHWVHKLLRERTGDVWGIDLDYDESKLPEPTSHYIRASAESFSCPKEFDVIFAGDIIEHLSNPGLFLESARRHLAPNGRLIITTPNAFNFWNLTGKLRRDEPLVNSDHTCYFNRKTLVKLLEKNGWGTDEVSYLYSLDATYRESWKKKALNVPYFILSRWTPKFIETLVVVATPR